MEKQEDHKLNDEKGRDMGLQRRSDENWSKTGCVTDFRLNPDKDRGLRDGTPRRFSHVDKMCLYRLESCERVLELNDLL